MTLVQGRTPALWRLTDLQGCRKCSNRFSEWKACCDIPPERFQRGTASATAAPTAPRKLTRLPSCPWLCRRVPTPTLRQRGFRTHSWKTLPRAGTRHDGSDHGRYLTCGSRSASVTKPFLWAYRKAKKSPPQKSQPRQIRSPGISSVASPHASPIGTRTRGKSKTQMKA
jgi:hypothetical protein